MNGPCLAPRLRSSLIALMALLASGSPSTGEDAPKSPPSSVRVALSATWHLGRRPWTLGAFLEHVEEVLRTEGPAKGWGRVTFTFEEAAAQAAGKTVLLDIRGVPLGRVLDSAASRLGLRYEADDATGSIRFSRRGKSPGPTEGRRWQDPEWKPEPDPDTKEASERLRSLLKEVPALRGEPLPLTRVLLMKIGGLRTPEAAAALEKLYRRWRDEAFRAYAAQAIGVVDGRIGAEILLGLLKRERRPSLRDDLLKALGELGAEGAARALLEGGLIHKDADVRAASARALGEFEWYAALDPLIQLVEDRETEPRLAALECLGRLATPEALEAVLASVSDRDELCALTALWALDRLDPPEPSAAEALRALVSEAPSLGRRVQAVRILGRLCDEGAVDRLLPLVDSPEWALRFASVQALGRIRTERAAGPLIQRLVRENGRLKAEIARALYMITGLDIGTRADFWRDWWAKNGDGFRPPPVLKPGAASHRDMTVAVYHALPVFSRRIVFLLDTSGSMGDPMPGPGRRDGGGGSPYATRLDFCRSELKKTLGALPEGALFNIIPFDTRVRPWSEALVPATAGNKAGAFRFLDAQEDSGGTNMLEALEIAFRDGEADTFYLLSDGFPSTDKEDLLRWIRVTNASRMVVIHTIGAGDPSSGGFLKRVARMTEGEHVSLR